MLTSKSPVRRPPSPKGVFLLGNLPEFGKDILGFFERCARDCGEVAFVRLAGTEAYVLSAPHLAEAVLITQNRNFVKHRFFWRHVRGIFGNGLLTSEGDFWLRQRRLAQPAFHRDRIAAYGDVMVEHTRRMLDRWSEWPDGHVVDVHPQMMHLTMEIVTRTLFGLDMSPQEEFEVDHAFDVALREVANRFRMPFRIPDSIPVPGNVRYNRAVKMLDRLIYRLIREHGDEDNGDLLSMLMAAVDDDGARMSEKQLRDEAITIFLAGHETTALALSWTFVLLSQNPRAAEALYREVDEVLGGREPAARDLEKLRYTSMVVQESMRLYPPAYAFGREAVEDCEIGGWQIPAGSTVFIAPWVMHRNAKFFEAPDEFRPERWAGDFAKSLPRLAYMPFGGGPRLCIGNGFAMMEATLLLAMISRRYRLQLAPDARIVPFPSITLRPKHGVWVSVERR